MGFGVNRVTNGSYRTIAKRHIETAGVGAAEAVVPTAAIANPVLGRSKDQTRRAALIVVESDIEVLIVGPFLAIGIMVGEEIFLAEHIGVARPIKNISQRDLTAFVADAGIGCVIGVRRLPVARVRPLTDVRRTGLLPKT